MDVLFFTNFHSLLIANGLDQTEIECTNSQQFTIKKKELTFYLHALYPLKSDSLYSKIETDFQFKIVHIYEDQWLKNQAMIDFRIKSLLGLNQTVAARACEIRKIDKAQADIFFNENHLQGSSGYAFKFGLFYKNELNAAMAFSKSRVMTDSMVLYRSYELIRFANKQGFTVTGGLQKLMKHFIREKFAQHIMTYIDLDWGDGESFAKMGFKDMGNTASQKFYIDPSSYNRLTEKDIFAKNLAVENYIAVQNSGSKKMILDLRTP